VRQPKVPNSGVRGEGDHPGALQPVARARSMRAARAGARRFTSKNFLSLYQLQMLHRHGIAHRTGPTMTVLQDRLHGSQRDSGDRVATTGSLLGALAMTSCCILPRRLDRAADGAVRLQMVHVFCCQCLYRIWFLEDSPSPDQRMQQRYRLCTPHQPASDEDGAVAGNHCHVDRADIPLPDPLFAKLLTMRIDMRRMISGILASIVLTGAASAAEQQATIEITGMTCPSCPYIAADAVQSVTSVEIVSGDYYQSAQLIVFIVTYDDALTTPQAIAAAPMEYGYPGRVLTGVDAKS